MAEDDSQSLIGELRREEELGDEKGNNVLILWRERLNANRHEVQYLVGVACALLAWAGSGCGCPDAWYEWLADSPAVSLPHDEAAHCYSAEWWYYTGLLLADDGREYGFEAVIFKAAPGLVVVWPVDVYVAHFAITDVADETFAYDQIRTISSQPATGHGFHLTTPLLALRGSEGRDHIHGIMSDGSYEIDLEVTAGGDAVLHGEKGYVRYGAGGGSFYYSRPRMTASGTLRDGDQVLSVSGDVWFDRQWGRDVNNPFLKWDWFSLRLDDGTAVMLYRFIDADTSLEQGTLSEADGGVSGLEQGDFTVTDIEFWTSPGSGATYPVRWQVEIPSAGLVLDVNRVLDNQELDARATTLNVYWEGLCFVTGRRYGEPVSGHAYVEMTNYNLPCSFSITLP